MAGYGNRVIGELGNWVIDWGLSESDESLGWLETIDAAGLLTKPEWREDVKRLLREADELTAIFSVSAGTARRNERLKRDQSATRRGSQSPNH